jgi:hypothetical protein
MAPPRQMAEWPDSERNQRKAHRARAPQPGTVRVVRASGSSEISDARGLELARNARWRFRAFVLCTTVLPLGAVTWMSWSTSNSEPNWVEGPSLVVLLDLLGVSIYVFATRSAAKAVRKTSHALPDAYLVCLATDTNPGNSVAASQLIVQRSGVSLWYGRGTKIRPEWELSWADIAAAAVVEYTEWHRFDKFDTRPAVYIARTDGQSKLLLLVDKNRRTDALMDFPRHVAALINEHAGRQETQPLNPV